MNQKDQNTGKSGVVDFSEKRAQKLDEKRRKTERLFFKQILGVYSVSESASMVPIEILDVSEEGCALLVPFDAEKVWPKDTKNLTIRMYFSQDTYLPVQLEIKNSKPFIQEGARYTRYGCQMDQTVSTYQAWTQFVKFLKVYSELSMRDAGAKSFFYL